MNNPHDNDRGSANKRQSPSLFDPVKPNQAACNKSKENKNISNVPTSNVTSASSPPKNSPQFENSCRSHSRASQSKNQRQHKKKQKSSSKPSSTSSNPHRRGIRSKRSSQRKEKEKENRPPLPTSALSLIASPSPTDRSKTPVCAMDANEPTVLSSNMDTPLVREVLAESEPLMTDTRNADAVTEQSEPQSPSQSQQDAAPPSPPFNVTDTSSNGSPNQNDMSNQSTSASCDKSSPPPPPPPSTTVPASESSENITAQSMMLTEHNRPVNRGVLFYSLFAVTAFSWFLSVIYGLFFKAKRKQLPPIDEPLLLLSASELTARIKNRSLKCEQVIRAYINRIEQVQKHLNAVIDSRFDEAIQEAKTIDQQLKNATLAKSLLSKPLLGVPFSCKDSIAVKGMVHTAGSWYRRNVKAEEDAPVVANLRAAGAIPLVMTNTPEFVMWCESNNVLYGRSNNPYDLSRVVGGSSGGEGALIGAAGSLLGIGSDVGGSIRIPAMFNGIFGHKTTMPYVPTGGMFPEPPQAFNDFLCFGPITRYATDLSLMFSAMSGGPSESLKLDKPVDLSNVKFYYMLNDGGSPISTLVDGRITDVIIKVAKFFENDHKARVQQVNFSRFMMGSGFFGATMNYTNTPKMRELVTCGHGEINPFIEVVKFMFGSSHHTLPIILLCFMEYLPSSINRQSEANRRSIAAMKSLRSKLHKFLGEDSVLLFPTWPTLAPKHNQTLFRPFDLNYTTIINTMSVPSTHATLGLDPYSKLPIGLQVIAGPGQDRLSIAVAVELERKFGGWVPPS